MMELFQRIANDMQTTLDDDLIMAIEAACITTAEYEADPAGCRQRVRGAQEEFTDFTL